MGGGLARPRTGETEEIGADGYVAKPFEPTQLLDIVARPYA